MLWYKSRRPDQIIAVPFFGVAATFKLGEIVRPHHSVLEFGAGGSTLWLANRCAKVTSVENDAEWYEVVKGLAPSNVDVIHSTGEAIPDGVFDVIIIDGDPPALRCAWIDNAPRHLSRGGWIILDNANRPEYLTQRASITAAADYAVTVDCNEANTLYLVTDFYRFAI